MGTGMVPPLLLGGGVVGPKEGNVSRSRGVSRCWSGRCFIGGSMEVGELELIDLSLCWEERSV